MISLLEVVVFLLFLAVVSFSLTLSLVDGQSSMLMPYPVPTIQPSVVYQIEFNHRSLDDQLLLTSLQGRLAQQALNLSSMARDGIETAGAAPVILLYKVVQSRFNASNPLDDDSDLLFFDYYARHYTRVTMDNTTLVTASLVQILTVCRTHITGYILTLTPGDQPDAVSVAISLAAITPGSIIVTSSHMDLMRQLNVPMLHDVRTAHNETAFIVSFAPFNTSKAAIEWPFSRRFFACQDPHLATSYLSDWTIMNGVVMIHHLPTANLILQSVTQPQSVFTAWMGWTPDGEYEDYWLHAVSQAGGMVWASDTLSNLATHAFFHNETLVNPTHMNPPHLPNNTHKHTVAFLWTDGDSLCADEHGIANGARWRSAARNLAPMTFGVDASFAHLAPGILGWYYETAAHSINASLVTFAPAYTYPNELDAIHLPQWAQLAAEAMKAADMHINYYIGFNYSIDDASVLLAQPIVDGVVYFEYLYYYLVPNNTNGTTLWANNKPYIAIRESLWQGHTTPEYIVDLLNHQVRDESVEAGYSVIAVEAWYNTAQSVLQVIEALPQDVIIVKLDELIQLMKNNIKHKRTYPEYDQQQQKLQHTDTAISTSTQQTASIEED